MIGTPDNGRVQELGLSVAYTFSDPNMRAFAEYRQSRYDQIDDGDYAIENNLRVGFVWSFGNAGAVRAATRTDLPNYLEWVTASDGHLE